MLHINKALTPLVYRVPRSTGNAQQGETLAVDTGTWDTIASFTYQWQRCDEAASSCTDISGATSRSYTATPNDVNFVLRVEVSAVEPVRHRSRGIASDGESHPTARSGSTMRATKHTGAPWLRRGRFSG